MSSLLGGSRAGYESAIGIAARGGVDAAFDLCTVSKTPPSLWALRETHLLINLPIGVKATEMACLLGCLEALGEDSVGVAACWSGVLLTLVSILACGCVVSGRPHLSLAIVGVSGLATHRGDGLDLFSWTVGEVAGVGAGVVVGRHDRGRG